MGFEFYILYSQCNKCVSCELSTDALRLVKVAKRFSMTGIGRKKPSLLLLSDLWSGHTLQRIPVFD
jgi:hypothetical protein